MIKFFEKLLDLIYKKKCYICKSSKYSLKICPECFDRLEFCDFRVNRIINGVDIFCAGFYTKELQKIIRGLKYHNQKELAYYQAKFMYEYFCKIPTLQDKKFILVPVPLHKKRMRKRGYNHMELVCKEFALLSGFEYDFELIKRIKDTKPQYNLSRQQRLKNLENAFEVNVLQNKAMPILLMDDICTTGSTFEEMINTLNDAGMYNITCLATATPN